MVRPLIADLEMPSQTLQMLAENGDTLRFALGTKVQIPANALVDADGKPVKGEVKIRCRHYLDAIDFSLAGINMTYDSAGTAYTLESDGMVDLRAFQNGQELFLKEGKEIQITIPGLKPDADFNLYRYDSIGQDWQLLQERLAFDSILETMPNGTREEVNLDSAQFSFTNGDDLPPKPLKANASGIQIAVAVPEEAMTPELRIFENTMFELLPEDTTYKDEDMQRAWDWAEVEATSRKGVYKLIFTARQVSKSYLVKPVYEGQDYEEALKTYQAEERRIREEKRQELQAAKKAMARKRRLEVNRMQEGRVQAAIKNAENEEQARAIQAQNDILYRRMAMDGMKLNRIQRSFSANGFGTYNCDRIWQQPFTAFNPIVLNASNSDSLFPDNLDFTAVNARLKITSIRGREVRLARDEDFTVMGVYLDRFYYLPKMAVKDLIIDRQTKSAVIPLKEHQGKMPKTYAEVRALLAI